MKAQSTATSVLNLTTRNSTNNVVLHPTAGSSIQSPQNTPDTNDHEAELCPVDQALVSFLVNLIQAQVKGSTRTVQAVANRLAIEVTRICRKSDRIQASGEVNVWQHSLAENRIQKYLDYYRLGSRQGRVELQSRLSAIAYRYIAPAKTQLGFQGRCNLLEDFLQGFYIEVLKAFRRENHLEVDYTPRTRLELAEYMAFSEQYAKRRISLPGCYNQQLLVLRAQSFAKRLPAETCVDIEMAVDSPKSDDADSRSSALQQIREQMVADVTDPAEAVLRDRIIRELVEYLEEQDQPACIDYLALRLQDMAASEIDEVLCLTPRQRDYLQQRFKYHVEKFAQSHNWQLVHQWLGADLDKNLGLSPKEWTLFLGELNAEQQNLLALKQQQMQNPQHTTPSDAEIAQQLGWTPKRVQRRWSQIVSSAWKVRNTNRIAKPEVQANPE
ncbi:HetZ-related protein [Leptothoe sp. PORK10 BA2]|uniref:HetZ-related protein n=1 Tax=Leptothoe sp. PORK10 BA2 TaxID=3110254 RepID=UPI002B1FB54B|nr:HetZ-related protein [Leptothoe sp. PORK10 BA2]MEA5462466.1 HetZ-related protein [Leptothoe sp. PORK10 BA2]